VVNVSNEKPNNDDSRLRSLLSSLTVADKRFALVTFLSTLAANIATAIIVALGLIAYNATNRFKEITNNPDGKHAASFWIVLFVLTIFKGGGYMFG
jgi:hypothetical protein